MPASLAEQLYARWRELLPADSIWTAWATLDPQYRAAWERVAEVARELCASAVVGYRCQCGIDHMFETREQIAVERDEAIRQRDEAQRAVRDGFPATVAVIRQQRDEAVASRAEAEQEIKRLRSALAKASNFAESSIEMMREDMGEDEDELAEYEQWLADWRSLANGEVP